ncbi:MAG: MaoC family dehydratase N-terminal domain-containing protein [Candidatus Tectomicrobia bacterium]|nr:MaoC family dehydratase N-terminal domain-containing protein [Candidatus Tectomicrobia bacterium]
MAIAPKKVKFIEEVNIGDELPVLEKFVERIQLVKYAGASGDFNPIHQFEDVAKSQKLPGIIAHGMLSGGFLGQYMTDWVPEGALKKLTFSFRAMTRPEDTVSCKGKITDKYTRTGQHYIECEIWTENQKGEKLSPGTATVVLPSRGE